MMLFLSILWSEWSQLFNSIPYGNPWVASFAMVAVVVLVSKMIRGVREFA